MIKTFWVDAKFVANSDCKVDGEALTLAVNRCVAHLDEDGFDIISITPVISGGFQVETFDERFAHPVHGSYTSKHSSGVVYTSAPATCSSFGYSFTQGMMIVAKLVDVQKYEERKKARATEREKEKVRRAEEAAKSPNVYDPFKGFF